MNLQERLDEFQYSYLTRGDFIRAFLLAGRSSFANQKTGESIDEIREEYNVTITFDGGTYNGITVPPGTKIQCTGEEYLHVKSLMKLKGEI